MLLKEGQWCDGGGRCGEGKERVEKAQGSRVQSGCVHADWRGAGGFVDMAELVIGLNGWSTFVSANFGRFVLGCLKRPTFRNNILYSGNSLFSRIFLRSNKIHTLLHRSAFQNSVKFRQTFSHFCSFILKILFTFCNYGAKFRGVDAFFQNFRNL